MREIKFRAWDKVLNEYFYNGELSNGDILVLHLDGRIEISDDDTYNAKDFILEQFTGLCDTNGKEIYEGDILTDPRYEEPFIVEYSPNVAGYVGWGDDRICGCYLITEEDIEIVGNIHENPELLEGVR